MYIMNDGKIQSEKKCSLKVITGRSIPFNSPEKETLTSFMRNEEWKELGWGTGREKKG